MEVDEGEGEIGIKASGRVEVMGKLSVSGKDD